MARAKLTIDLDALCDNWRALDRHSGNAMAGAVVKADGYGLDSGRVAVALAQAGARHFFVALAEEGARVRQAIGEGIPVSVFSGHMAGDAALLRDFELTPMLNSPEQVKRQFDALPAAPFGIQLDSGMNRLGMEAADWAAVRGDVLARDPDLIMSHLACADEPDHEMNAKQLRAFRDMTDDAGVPRSLSATGGILLGPDYRFELTRPGVGLYGGAPFMDAKPVAHLKLPVIQCRDLEAGEAVGYGVTWHTDKPARIATVAAGYADGLIRAMSNRARLFADDVACPLAGRVSMDLLTVDITHLDNDPTWFELLGHNQTVDDVADAAGTIGYEILTSLRSRYERVYTGEYA
ncbi:alanine racemase [Qingshengfaniella alkalisoli]|uniref:Alanine racemase n=1 Tax=Qingshengfaniella alkalisoli TaxID=2599296 RepID=A0A5B8IT31_9RHOB|nr:alanine racemase [Qingshengfaniella alkalisoli]QDY68784.1 alanine racemase [Qingshengfaniella alkalisoli]